MIEYENLNRVNEPYFPEFKKVFSEFLSEGWFILGKNVEAFEKEFADYCGGGHFVGLASGLDALLFSLKAYDFPAGSEVIVPSNTYIATILSVLQAGLKPVLVEPRLSTYNINPDLIETSITPKTKAIMIVHLYGKACEVQPIQALCKKYNLKLIEDCAQAHGARISNKSVGTFGDIGAFSFYPTKNLGALGDAGGALLHNPEHVQVFKRLRNYGSDVKYYNEVIGFNSRLDEVQAAFLRIKLRNLESVNNHKRELAKIYLEELKQDFVKPIVQEDFHDVYHIFNIRHPKRDELKAYLMKHDIKTEIHYPNPPHKQKAMQGVVSENSFPVSEEIHNTTLSLPISSFHTKDNIYRVIEIINKF